MHIFRLQKEKFRSYCQTNRRQNKESSALYIKQMERDKYMALLINGEDCRGKLKISENSYKDLHWWLRDCHTVINILG
nr:unnamed protein product [Callosobruchus chinensis]